MSPSLKLVNDCDKLMRTPLHWACKRGYEKVAAILVDYGAETGEKDYKGRTCIDIAEEKEHHQMVKVSKIDNNAY